MRAGRPRPIHVLSSIIVFALAPFALGCGSGGGGGSTRLMYIVNTAANTVSQYQVNGDGSVTPLAASTVPTGAAPKAIAVDSTGNFAYVVNSGNDTVSQYEVGANGSLTPLSPPTVATGHGPTAIAVHPNGKHVYVANSLDNSITVYNVSGRDVPTKQVLIQAQIVQTNESALKDIGVDFTGDHLYGINAGSNSVSQFSIGSNGTLSALNPASLSLPFTPTAMAMNPKGPSFYIVSSTAKLVAHAIISSTGTVSLQATPQLITGLQPSSVAVDPSGQTIYVANSGDNTVSQYFMDNGIMKALAASSAASVISQPKVVALQGQDAFILGGGAVGTYNKGQSQVPLLGDIPIIGSLLRSNALPAQGDQLVVFVTPRVINPAD